jgi:hypothetical protein
MEQKDLQKDAGWAIDSIITSQTIALFQNF